MPPNETALVIIDAQNAFFEQPKPLYPPDDSDFTCDICKQDRKG